MDNVIGSVVGALVSGILIIGYDGLKRYRDQEHEKKKFRLWQELSKDGIYGRPLSALSNREHLVYELRKDGLVEVSIANNVFVIKTPPVD